MATLRTVLLHHTGAPQGDHYDWLLEDLRLTQDPNARLWAARVAHTTSHWHSLRMWDLTPLPPHRREYLTYEGPLTDNRGSIARVDQGTFTASEWSDDRIVIDVKMNLFTGVVELRRTSPERWQAALK